MGKTLSWTDEETDFLEKFKSQPRRSSNQRF